MGFYWLVFLVGDNWAIQSNILSDCTSHWFEGSVLMLSYLGNGFHYLVALVEMYLSTFGGIVIIRPFETKRTHSVKL